MKTVWAALVLAAAGAAAHDAPVGAPAQVQETPNQNKVVVRHDRFKEEVVGVVEVRITGIEGQLPRALPRTARIVAVNAGAVLVGAKAILLAMTFDRPGWRYLECQDVAVLIDGKPVKFTSRYSGTVETDGVRENVFVVIGDDLARFAAASRVELRICHDEMMVAAESQGAFASMLAAVGPTSPETP